MEPDCFGDRPVANACAPELETATVTLGPRLRTVGSDDGFFTVMWCLSSSSCVCVTTSGLALGAPNPARSFLRAVAIGSSRPYTPEIEHHKYHSE